VGETRTVTANVTGQGDETPNVVFNTASTSIALTWTGTRATIQCGSAGTATVTAQANTSTASGTGTATVTVQGPVASVTVTPTAAFLAPGSTITITPTVTLRPGAPNGTITTVRYSTSNPGAATVLTNANGTATVTIPTNLALIGQQAVITTTSIVDPTAQATTTITIADPAALIASVVPGTASLSLNAGDTATVTATVTLANLAPSGTSRALTFRSSDPTIATVDANGLVTAKKAGTATITIASAVAPTVSGTTQVTVFGTGTGGGGQTGNVGVTITGVSTINNATGQSGPFNPASVAGTVAVSYTLDPAGRIIDGVALEFNSGSVIIPFPSCISGVTGITAGSCAADTDTRNGVIRVLPNGTYTMSLVVTYRQSATSAQQRLVTAVASAVTVNNP
jgi:hypothetical protein